MGYECLLAGLPELKAGAEAPLTMEVLNTLLEETLTDQDLKQLALLKMHSTDSTITDLKAYYDDSILNQPSWWEDVQDLLSEEDLLTQVMYEYGKKNGNRFVRRWFQYNQDMNNVLVATICRKHGLDVRHMIVGDNEVATVLRKNLPQKDFGLSGVMDNLQEVMSIVEIDNLMEREKHMDAIRFCWLDDETRFINFSLENVLAYYLQNEMLNRWSTLTVEQGEQIFRNIVADFKKGIKID